MIQYTNIHNRISTILFPLLHHVGPQVFYFLNIKFIASKNLRQHHKTKLQIHGLQTKVNKENQYNLQNIVLAISYYKFSMYF